MEYEFAQSKTKDRFRTLQTIPYPEQVTRSAATAGVAPAPPQPIRLIRLPVVRKRLADVGRSTIYDWMNPNSPRYDPSFPIPIKLSFTGGAIAWIEQEIDEWLSSRVRVRSGGNV